MGENELGKLNVDKLCEMWAQRQRSFELDVIQLLDKSKRMATQLRQHGEVDAKARFKLEQLMMQLSEERQRRHEEVTSNQRLQEWYKMLDKMRGRISRLVDSLAKIGLTVDVPIKSLCKTGDYSLHSYEELSQALQECETLRVQNMALLIDQVRTEIVKWCDRTLQYPTVRNFHNDFSSEELLRSLEQQLDGIMDYYNSNKSIFELYAKRAELWTRMEALEFKTTEPKRYQNRGGVLLLEERERKTISTRLPQIELSLKNLALEYEQRTGRPFRVQGEELLSRIAADWLDFREAKQQQTIARKKAASVVTLEPMRSPLPGYLALRKTTSVPYFDSPSTCLGSGWSLKLHRGKQRKPPI